MAAGAMAGGLVVLLDPLAGRFETAVGERGLVRVVRVGPSGQVPGGIGFAQRGLTPQRMHARPWSPAGLVVREEDGGRRLDWTPRVRVGDVWDLEPAEVDPRRFRIRILKGDVERRVFEVEGVTSLYPAVALGEDFPTGIGSDAAAAVAQYGAGFGWGVESRAPLIV